MSFNDFLAGYKADELEEVRKVQTVGTDFSELMRKYERLLDEPTPYLDEMINTSYRDEMILIFSHFHKITTILTPAEINSFLQTTQQYADHRYYHRTGLVISSLINNSYSSGYNGFSINTTEDLPRINFVMNNIIGKETNPLLISVQGNIGYYVGYRTQYSAFTFNGSVGECGDEAQNSTFLFNGEAGLCSGRGAKNCTFKTPIWRNIEKLKKSLPEDNTLIYIDQGKEVKIDFE